MNRRRKSAVGQSAGGTGIDPEVLYKVARNASRRPRSFSSSTDIFGRQSATAIYPPVLLSSAQELHQSRFSLSLSRRIFASPVRI